MSDPFAAPPSYPSSLSIHRLMLSVRLGVDEQERAQPQAVEVNLTFYFRDSAPGSQDDTADYLCYDKISSRIQMMCEGREFRLLEYLGTEIYRCVRGALEDTFPHKATAEQIKIVLGVTKCHLPIAFVEGGATYRYSDLPPGAWVPPC